MQCSKGRRQKFEARNNYKRKCRRVVKAQFLPRQWLFWQFSSKAAVLDLVKDLNLSFQIQTQFQQVTCLRNVSKQTSCSSNFICFSIKNIKTN